MEAPPSPDHTSQNIQIDDEPRLKYAPFGGSAAVLRHRRATCMCVSDKIIALGTAQGSVHVLDYDGNEVKRFQEHKAEVTDLSFCQDADSLASSAADGSVVVVGLCSEETWRFRANNPVTSLALDPRYSTRKTKELIYGTKAGTLFLNSKGWLGNSETLLFQGKGPVHCVRMQGTLLAWLTDSGLRVYDTATHTRLGTFPAPIVLPSLQHPLVSGVARSLAWRGDGVIYVGWGHHATVVAVVPATMSGKSTDIGGSTPSPVAAARKDSSSQTTSSLPPTPPTARGSTPQPRPTHIPSSVPHQQPTGGTPVTPTSSSGNGLQAKYRLDTVAHVDTGAPVLGLAPFGTQLAVLTWAQEGSDPPSFSDGAGEGEEGNSPGATVLGGVVNIVNTAGTVLFSDAVSLPFSPDHVGKVHLEAFYPGDAPLLQPTSTVPTATSAAAAITVGSGNGISLPSQPPTSSPTTSERDANGQPLTWWHSGAEPLYFIVGPKGITVGRPRTTVDRIAWLASRARFSDAMHLAQQDPAVPAAVKAQLGETYLQHLIEAGNYGEAAAVAPQALTGDAAAWERWVYTFAQRRCLTLLAPHLPTAHPQLSVPVYDLAAAAFLHTVPDHAALLDLLEAWPAAVYNGGKLLGAVTNRLKSSGTRVPSPMLKRVAALLYAQQGQHEEALSIYLELRDPGVFGYIERHLLQRLVAPHAAQLADIDAARTLELCIAGYEEIPPAVVARSFQAAAKRTEQGTEEETVWRRRLHDYLDGVYAQEPAAVAAFAGDQVELCAEFAPPRLLHFLATNSSYPLDTAFKVCEERGLVREMVFVLGRMGSADRALRLIVEQLRDVGQAVEFVAGQGDDDLWDLLISLALGDAALAGELLDHAGGYIDPLRVVSRIPIGMSIPSLQSRLVKIVADFKAHMSLQASCNAVLAADCVALIEGLYQRLCRAVKAMHVRQGPRGGGSCTSL